MHSAMFTTLLLTAATGAVAGPFEYFSGAAVTKRQGSACTAVDVDFHFNDTSIGTITSCTLDVMYRGVQGEATRRATAAEDCDENCVDGPSTNYTVVSGDTLEKIAAEFNSGVCNIAAANSLDNPDFIVVDQHLVIPTNVCTPDNDSCRTSAGTATCVPADAGVAATYTIESGDTFFLVAAELGLTLDALVAANPDVDPNTLAIGQVINVPICEA